MFVTDLSDHLELVKETGGGCETGASEQRALTRSGGLRTRAFVLVQFSYLCQPREEVDVDRFLLSSPPFCGNVLRVGPPPSYRNLSPGCLSASSLMCLLITSVVVMATYDRSYGMQGFFFFF